MVIHLIARVVESPGSVEEEIGLRLKEAALAHFSQYLGQRDLGFGYGSCTAAVAIVLHHDYDRKDAQHLRFSILYGASQMYRGLDPDFNAMHGVNVAPTRFFSNSFREEHAEQSAIRTAAFLGRQFFAHNEINHIYVDFPPCPSCYAWLDNHAHHWWVHYSTPLNDQAPVVKEKKRKRAESFGRQLEPPMKRPRKR